MKWTLHDIDQKAINQEQHNKYDHCLGRATV